MRKISVSLSGHRTSITLENEFIDALKTIAERRKISIATLLREIDDNRNPDQNLSSAVRVFVLKNVK